MNGWQQVVHAAFTEQPAIYQRVLDAVERKSDPNSLSSLFEDIAVYVQHLKGPATTLPTNSKKRKLDNAGTEHPHTNGTTAFIAGNPTFECKDVSFQIPARKKLKLELVADVKDRERKEIRLLNQQTGETEYALMADDIDQIFCLPVPEKQQRQWNFVVVPKLGHEQVLFTMNETAPALASSAAGALAENDTYVTATERELDLLLRPFGKRVVRPSEDEFASSIPQPHRKGEKAYHIKAHRGSYLFLLPNGIVFGFKKPVLFFPFELVESVSYSSVLQRTFNLSISSHSAPVDGMVSEADAAATDIEFSMLDQADFAGIDEYVKRHGLNDASMAADRRAKAYNVNKPKESNGEVTGDAEGGEEDGQTELQKAEQMLQDQEDEEEEDYEASGGESDGEGEESDEDGEDGAGEDVGEEDDEEE